jgi:phosphoglycerate dehydrogenase-like enzyme
LLRALNEGWIAGAALDAHSEEPLPATSPFWTAPNTIVTPHNGATSKVTPERGFDYFVANLERYRQRSCCQTIFCYQCIDGHHRRDGPQSGRRHALGARK